MGRARSRHRHPSPRSTVPLHRRILLDPVALRSWLLVGAAAVVVAALVGHVVSRAEATRRRWGETRSVVVAGRPIPAGGRLAGATEVRTWPVALVPIGAVRAGEVDDDARATMPVTAGSVLTTRALGPIRSSDPASGRPRLAIPLGRTHPPLRRGDRVEVWATTDPSLTNGRLSTDRVVGRAMVTAVDDASATLAVSPEEVPEMAEAVTISTITVVVLP